MPAVQVETPDGKVFFTIDHHVDMCPHCGSVVQALMLVTSYINTMRFEIIYKCPGSQCGKSFIGEFTWWTNDEYRLSATAPRPKPLTKDFDKAIEEISSSFIQIYNEAYLAEQMSLRHVCGMGYRKALEFLIKDYVISVNPDSKDIIMDHKTTLGRVIKEFISDTRIVKTAERASWLGNDETHYVRKWEDKDINDLKILIELVSHWISMERLTSIYLNSMN